MITDIFSHIPHLSSLSSLLLDYLNVKVSSPASMLEFRGLVKLEIFSGEYFDLYSWWGRLASKCTVSVSMNLVEDMDTHMKRSITKKTWVLISVLFLS